MTGSLRFGGLALLLAIGACDTGSVGGGNGGPDANDPRNMDLGILCNATFKLTGTYQQSMAQPSDILGCWPVGTWTFTASIDQNQCQPPPSLLPQYQFKVDATPSVDGTYDWTTTYMTDPNAHYRIKISGDGGGICQGGFELYSMDGKQLWNFKPSLETGNVLDGFGEYALYDADQWTNN
jgi:hypothetical protein